LTILPRLNREGGLQIHADRQQQIADLTQQMIERAQK
jgi:hypothetical protein